MNDTVAALGPFIAVAGAAVIVVLVIAFRRGGGLAAILSAAGLVAAAAALGPAWHAAPGRGSDLMTVDGLALYFMALVLAAAFGVILVAHGYLARRTRRPEEFYALLLFATLGALVLAAAGHFATFFLGLETLSVSLYALTAYLRAEIRSVEAGLKYLVLAGASSAALLFGMALVFAETGVLGFRELALSGAFEHPGAVLLAGFALLLVGIGFKLALVPFHMWTPDVYEGAPAPATAFLATASKGAMFALFIRLADATGGLDQPGVALALAVIATLSMFTGNLLALFQQNVKRLLAYSSIAHFGYLLVALLAGGQMGMRAAMFYLAAYFVTTLGAFGVVAALSTAARDADQFDDYHGLYWRRPWMAAVFTACLLSLAGIPLTGGFLAKFYVVTAGIGSALWGLVLVLVANSAIGLFYYLRLIVAMLERAGDEAALPVEAAAQGRVTPAVPAAAGAALSLLVIVLVWLGVYPSTLDRMIIAVLGGR